MVSSLRFSFLRRAWLLPKLILRSNIDSSRVQKASSVAYFVTRSCGGLSGHQVEIYPTVASRQREMAIERDGHLRV